MTIEITGDVNEEFERFMGEPMEGGRETSRFRRWLFGRSKADRIAKRTERGNVPSRFLWFFVGAAIGAVAIYAFDPQQGRRRRALLRDKGIRWRNDSIWAVKRHSRDFQHRLAGLPYKVRDLLQQETEPSDETLVNRVRAVMGRFIRHPGSIEVTARDGEIILRGLILAHEVDQLLRRARAVRGVRTIHNQLNVHQGDDRVPGLQGEGKPYLQ